MSAVTFNGTSIDPDFCTLALCPISEGQITYQPNLIGNGIFLGVFGLAFFLQLFLGTWKRTWGYMVGLLLGLALEIVGYVARIQLHNNPFSSDAFLMYIICLTIGPAFLSGAIYLCLARIVVLYGEELSRIRPRTYTITFIFFDIVALVLQALGGGMLSGTETEAAAKTASNIMIAGLSAQVGSLTLFMILAADFAIRVVRSKSDRDNKYASLTRSLQFKGFLMALAFAVVCIFVRSCFRVAELKEGFSGALANDEITFMILEGTMISLAVIALTVFHPGVCFQGYWEEVNFKLRGKVGGSKSGSSSDSSHAFALETTEYRR
ncbi:hypothetical protein PLICRDRAFT_110372 [Plicaturopsis crispa FD-325 SS-3]|nr:hypothetical protein PLICRDRAFT_110372 [Plicaturopsis crispa FD-325 SS-3]